MDSHITWSYHIAAHHCSITWVYNKHQKNMPHHQGYDGPRVVFKQHIAMCLPVKVEIL